MELESSKIKFRQLFISSWTSNKAIAGISAIQSEDFTQSSTFSNRLIIPIPFTLKPDFTFGIKTVPFVYSLEDIPTYTHAIKVIIARKTFLMYVATDHSMKPTFKYLVIECEHKLSNNLFHDYCYSILLSFGFITGELILNEGYFIQYNKADMVNPFHFTYTRLRNSISCTYVPVYTNPYGWLHDATLHALYKDKVRLITIEEFSELSRIVHTHDEYKSLLILILETAVVSLVSGPSNLSVGLESLSNTIRSEDDRPFSVVNKSDFRKIRVDLINALSKFQPEIGEDSIKYFNQED